jgi:hypothetical protein
MRRAIRRPATRIAIEPTAMATDHTLVAAIPPNSSPTRGMKSSPLFTCTPSILAIWLTRMSSANPPTNPTRIGSERKFARKPRRKAPTARNITPAIIAWASERAMYSLLPAAARPISADEMSAAAAASGDAISCLVEARTAKTAAGTIREYSPAVGGRPATWA